MAVGEPCVRRNPVSVGGSTVPIRNLSTRWSELSRVPFPAGKGHARPVCSLLTDDHTCRPPFPEPWFLSSG